MPSRTYIITLISISLSGTLMTITANKAYAEELSFGIFPTVSQLVGKPGETIEARFMVRNHGDTTVQLNNLLQSFSAAPSGNGEVRYEEKQPELFQYVQVIDNGTAVRELSLVPGEKKELTLLISVPEDEKPADYYFSLVLLSRNNPIQPEITQEGISARSSISGGVASHILLSVDPQVTEDLKLVEFSGPPLSRNGQMEFTIKIANEGNHYRNTQGNIRIKNALGGPGQELEIPATTILAHSSRLLTGGQEVAAIENTPTVVQSQNLIPGIYRATLSLNNSTNNNPIEKTIYFTVAPLEFLIGVVVVVVVLIFIRDRMKKRFSR